MRGRARYLVEALERARARLLDHEPRVLEDAYEEMRAEVDRALREVALGVASLGDGD